MAKRKKRRRKGSGQLVCSHLEFISAGLLEKYQSVISEYVHRRPGIYALFKDHRLYYVGLASNLKGRLKMHLHDRHKGKWNQFSIYLTVGDVHLRELESLVLRIAGPKANKVTGKFTRSQDLHRLLRRAIKETHKRELEELVPRKAQRNGKIQKSRPGLKAKRRGTSSEIAKYATRRMRLRWQFKGKTYKATLRTNGIIRFRGKTFTSPSVAASSITKRAMNGWEVWRFERAPGDWVKLDTLRR